MQAVRGGRRAVHFCAVCSAARKAFRLEADARRTTHSQGLDRQKLHGRDEVLQQVAQIAEADGHHPDLHLAGYRNVSMELWTHAIGGLSENDFILAAKIDQVPVEVKKQS